MADERFHLEVNPGEITVTAPGTSHCVVYERVGGTGLMAKSSSGKANEAGPADDAPMTHTQFRAGAWRLAHDKARELGWIV
jgi:hypothetical protein